MRSLPLVIVGALAVGYVLGHFHVAGHIANWCFDVATADRKRNSATWFAKEAMCCLFITLALVARPRSTWYAIRHVKLPVFAGIAWALTLLAGTAFLFVKVVTS